jgi:Transmembrane exosortase (Exosortase_EpsH)
MTSTTDPIESQPTATVSMWDWCVGFLPGIAALPLMIGQVYNLWQSAETKLGLAVWLFVIVVVAIRARGGVTRHSVRMSVAIILLLIGSGCLTWGLLNWALNWGHFSVCLLLVAWGLGRCSARSWHEVVSWGFLLAFTIPLVIVYRNLDGWITSQAGEFASNTLDILSIPHMLDQLQISLKHGQFNVGSATSAKLGLYVVVCCAAIWCWIWSRSLSVTLMILMSAVLALLLTRYLAVLVVSYGVQNYQSDWSASGKTHYFISAGSFLLCLLLTAMFERLILSLSRPIPSSNPDHFTLFATANAILQWPNLPQSKDMGDIEEMEEFQTFRNQLEQWRLSWYSLDWNKKLISKFSVFACTAVCGLLTIPAWLGAIRGGFVDQPTPTPALRLATIGQAIHRNLLPEAFGDFRLSNFAIAGHDDKSPVEKSALFAQWDYAWDSFFVNVTLQAPLTTWKAPISLSDSKRSRNTVELKDAASWAWFDCRQTNSLGGDTYLLQTCLADDLATPNYDQNTLRMSLPLVERLTGKIESPIYLYEIQVFCETGNPLPLDRLTELQKFFAEIRQQLQRNLPASQIQISLIPQG